MVANHGEREPGALQIDKVMVLQGHLNQHSLNHGHY